MTTYVALLRGINIGPNNRVPMAGLRALLTKLGYTDVSTLLQSGNAVFGSRSRPAKLEKDIQRGIADEFGLTIPVLVRTGADLRAVIAADPLGDIATNGARYVALLLSEEPDPALAAANDPVALDPDNVRVGDRVIYQWCPDGIHLAPGVSAFVEKKWKVKVTGRNWNTIAKLADLAT